MIVKYIKNIAYEKKSLIYRGLYILFLMYSCLMLWEVFIGPYRSHSNVRRYNLYPFKTIAEFILNADHYSSETIFINLTANIITFVPLGFFTSLFFKKLKKLTPMLLTSIIIITIIELGQFILRVGVLDIDDIILNTIGCIIGFIFYKRLKTFIQKERF